MCNLLPLAGPFATIIAAIAAVVVTWRLGNGQIHIAAEQKNIAAEQARLADIRLQHDLFDRRIPMFNASRDLINSVFHNSDISDEVWQRFMKRAEKSEFLFRKPIHDYIIELRDRGASLRGIVKRLDDNQGLLAGDERNAFAKLKEEQVAWFQNQFEVIIPKFMPSLALEKGIDTTLAKSV